MITTATFTKTELKIIKHLAEGMAPIDIAKHIFDGKIEKYWDHANNINHKFGTSNRVLLTHWAIAYGVVKLKTWNEVQAALGFPQTTEIERKKGLDFLPPVTYPVQAG